MPIRELHDDGMVQECIACGHVRHLDLAALVSASEVAGGERPEVLRVPSCDCGAQEFLFPPETPEHPAPGSTGHLHGLLVRELCARAIDGKRAESSDDLSGWFPDGLCLPSLRDAPRAEGDVRLGEVPHG